ncbi:MAG: sulfotransferase [Pseudomonadota bacterium]
MVAQIDADYLRLRWPRIPSRLLAYGLFEGRPLATKGRWINPLVFAGHRLYSAVPQLKQVRAPIFIIGVGRSGTTILGVVLSAHADVGFLNEPKSIWHFAHGGEDVIGSYDAGAARFVLSEDDATPRARQRLHRVYGAFLALSGAGRILDKYPELVFRVRFVREVFPDARFLFLTRNGGDAVASIDNWSARKGMEVDGERHDWWGREDRKWRLLVDEVVSADPTLGPRAPDLAGCEDHTIRAAVEWIVSMRAGLAAEAAFPDAVLRVSYEALCSDPKATLAQILSFCQLPPSAPMSAYAERVLRAPADAARGSRKPPLPDWLAKPFLATASALGYDGAGGAADSAD